MILQILALSLFTTVMAVAAFEDFRRLTIPNLLPLALCAGWPFYVAAVPVPGGAVLFARGWLGGGDVKLLSAATLWAGAPQALGLLVVTGLLGGALALILLSPLGKFASAARRRLDPPDIPPSHPGAP